MDFVEEIENRRTTNFKVTKIPVGELKKFKKLCKEEYGNIYFVGIIQLMKIKEKYEQLLNLFEKVDKPLKSNSKKLNTFGGKNE